ncbi:hypothetical protein [Aeromonas phage phiA014S]|uniref:Uncharacterized protein n=1 Tax=Aeromonas phage phiA014S TaxID=3119845 RepID=A0ABZ2CNU4_9CAUD
MVNQITVSDVSMKLYDRASEYTTGCAFYWVRELSLETRVQTYGAGFACEIMLVDYWTNECVVRAAGFGIAETMEKFINSVIDANKGKQQ